jgi:hypothetical protein
MDGSGASVLYAGIDAQPVKDQAVDDSAAEDVAAGAAGVDAEEDPWGKNPPAAEDEAGARCVQ